MSPLRGKCGNLEVSQPSGFLRPSTGIASILIHKTSMYPWVTDPSRAVAQLLAAFGDYNEIDTSSESSSFSDYTRSNLYSKTYVFPHIPRSFFKALIKKNSMA
jgi:hypothetical protein